MDYVDYEKVLTEAMTWVNNNYPTESVQHKAAFANSVAYLVTGMSGGYGGPSMREHLVSWSLGVVGAVAIGDQAITTVTPTMPQPGKWQFEDALQFAVPLCFDPAERYLYQLLQIQEREHCFDDDPIDLEILRAKK